MIIINRQLFHLLIYKSVCIFSYFPELIKPNLNCLFFIIIFKKIKPTYQSKLRQVSYKFLPRYLLITIPIQLLQNILKLLFLTSFQYLFKLILLNIPCLITIKIIKRLFQMLLFKHLLTVCHCNEEFIKIYRT